MQLCGLTLCSAPVHFLSFCFSALHPLFLAILRTALCWAWLFFWWSWSYDLWISPGLQQAAAYCCPLGLSRWACFFLFQICEDAGKFWVSPIHHLTFPTTEITLDIALKADIESSWSHDIWLGYYAMYANIQCLEMVLGHTESPVFRWGW